MAFRGFSSVTDEKLLSYRKEMLISCRSTLILNQFHLSNELMIRDEGNKLHL